MSDKCPEHAIDIIENQYWYQEAQRLDNSQINCINQIWEEFELDQDPTIDELAIVYDEFINRMCKGLI